MGVFELNKYVNNDIEILLMNKVIYHTYTKRIDFDETKKIGYLFPRQDISQKLYLDIAKKYNLEDIDYLFMTSFGLGDTYFLAANLEKFKKEKNAKVAILLKDYKYYEMVKSFDIDEIIVDESMAQRALSSSYCFCKKRKHSVISARFPYLSHIIPAYFGQHYAYLIGNNPDEILKPICIAQKFLEQADKEIEKLNLNLEKTIFLFPEAACFDYKVLKDSFWLNLAGEFSKMGYQVVFNTRNPVYKKYLCIFPKEIMLLVAMVSKVSNFVSFRSGINDICAGFGISNHIVLYPKDFKLIDRTGLDMHRKYHEIMQKRKVDFFNFYSLKKHFNLDQHEIVLNDDINKTASMIMEVVNKRRAVI